MSVHEQTETDNAARELEIARGREEFLREHVSLLEERLLEAETRVAESERTAERALALVAEIQQTSSWRVTAPLRAFRRLLSRS
jgi:uncharacterized coiled-coil protein SlyX